MVINNKRVSDRVKLVATKIIDYRWIYCVADILRMCLSSPKRFFNEHYQRLSAYCN
jgi:hypothetical protein